MSDLFWLTDEQMERLRPFFPKSHGKPRVDDRRVLSGIIFVNRNGMRWCDAPREYGPHKTLYNRWKRWGDMGIFMRMMDGLCPAGLQTGLFQTRDPVKSSRLMDALDAVNGRYGRGTIRLLSTGLDRTWRARQNLLSPAYTMRLEDIMEVTAW